MEDVLDFGTAELHSQMNVRIKNGLARVYAQLPLDHYREKSIITEEQWMAGDRLSYLFAASNCFSLRTSNYTDERGRALPSTEQTPAERFEIEYKAALTSMPHSLRTLLRNVCCFHDRTNDIGLLRDGLNDLIRFFGIKNQ